MEFIQRDELQLLAQILLRSNGIELGDDPRSEVEVAQALGFLILAPELGTEVTLPELATVKV